MENRPSLHLTSFALALAVIFCGSTIYYAYRESLYARYTETVHEQSLSQLLNSLEQLETSLEKAVYLPAGAMRQTLAADVWKESQTATAALASLPLGDKRLEQVETYIAQVGDYAYYLMRSSAYDRADEEEWLTFCSLYDNAAGMLSSVDHLKEQVDAQAIAFRQIDGNDRSAGQIDQQLTQVNDEFPAYASLIYDGPYSDHVLQRTPKALKGKRLYSMDDAKEKAASLLQVSPAELSVAYESDGQIPCYGFSHGSADCAISKEGGLALSMTDTRPLGSATMTAEQAVDLAQVFLRSMGLTDLFPTYHTVFENICTINFVPKEEGVIVYPDLIKVGVALDDGSVVRLDTAGYAMNHQFRDKPEATVALDTARAQVPETLIILEERQAYIPTTGYQEVLCWEFVCETGDGQHALLYVNCENGQVENLLLLIESENGTLTK